MKNLVILSILLTSLLILGGCSNNSSVEVEPEVDVIKHQYEIDLDPTNVLDLDLTEDETLVDEEVEEIKEPISSKKSLTSNNLLGLHDIVVPVNTDYNTVLDLLIDGLSATYRSYPIMDNVDLSSPGTYTVYWMTNDIVQDESCTITVE